MRVERPQRREHRVAEVARPLVGHARAVQAARVLEDDGAGLDNAHQPPRVSRRHDAVDFRVAEIALAVQGAEIAVALEDELVRPGAEVAVRQEDEGLQQVKRRVQVAVPVMVHGEERRREIAAHVGFRQLRHHAHVGADDAEQARIEPDLAVSGGALQHVGSERGGPEILDYLVVALRLVAAEGDAARLQRLVAAVHVIADQVGVLLPVDARLREAGHLEGELAQHAAEFLLQHAQLVRWDESLQRDAAGVAQFLHQRLVARVGRRRVATVTVAPKVQHPAAQAIDDAGAAQGKVRPCR